MKIGRLLAAQFVALTLLAALHNMALQLDLYWHFVWLDVASHFLGGIWVALVIQLVMAHQRRRQLRLAPLMLGVLLVGMGWELFELTTGLYPQSNYFFDTSLDLLMDMMGAAVGYYVARGLQQTA